MKAFKIVKEVLASKSFTSIIEKYKGYLFPRMVGIAFILAFVGFWHIEQKHAFESFTGSLQMLILNLPTEYGSANLLIPAASVIIAFILFYAVISAFFKDIIHKKIINNIRSREHVFVFGLNEITLPFLKGIVDKHNVIIVNTEKESLLAEELINQGFAILDEDLSAQLNPQHFKMTRNCLIALGDDRLNIDFAIKLIDTFIVADNKLTKRVILQIENEQIKEVFNQKLMDIEKLNEAQIDIKTFSYFEESANLLFEDHPFVSAKIIQQGNAFKTLVLGDGELAVGIIKNLLLLSNFPHKNKHEIYLLGENSSHFLEKIELKTHYSKDKFPSVEIVPVDLSFNNIAYYKHEIFTDADLQSLFICYDDEQANLDLAIAINNKALIKREVAANYYLALFSDYSFLKQDGTFIDAFTVFATKNKVLSYSQLIDEENYIFAKFINNGYGGEFDRNSLVIDENGLNKKWFNTNKFSDRQSSIAQAKHLNIKLQALGLQKEKSTLSKPELLKTNIMLFDEVVLPLLEGSGVDYELIHAASLELEKVWAGEAYQVRYCPSKYETYFEKLIESEHERWNAFHYIDGWEYHPKKDKARKLHDCLLPLEQFLEPHLQITILYDIYSILYIPNYLASASYILRKG